MNELLKILETYHTNRLGYMRDKARAIRLGAYQEKGIEEFWKNKGKLEILNEFINLEESLLKSDESDKEAIEVIPR